MKTRSGFNYSCGSKSVDCVPLYIANVTNDCHKSLESDAKKVKKSRKKSENKNLSEENASIKKMKELLAEKEKEVNALREEIAKNERNARYNRRDIEELRKEVRSLVSIINNNTEAFDTNNKLLDTINAELTCSICKELFMFATIINCGHSFCFGCIDEWKNCSVNGSCPVCREPISLISRQLCLDNVVSLIVDTIKPHLKQNRQILMNEMRNKVEIFDTIRRVAHAMDSDTDDSDSDIDGDDDVFDSDESEFSIYSLLSSRVSALSELSSRVTEPEFNSESDSAYVSVALNIPVNHTSNY